MRLLRWAVAGALALLAAGCGSSRQGTSSVPASSPPSYASEPFTHEQVLVEKGARLVVADGCSACHLSGGAGRAAPSFMSLAGHRVKLADGRRVLIDEALIRDALRRPGAFAMAGYDATPMIRAVQRADLSAHPDQIAELAAFIEQVGPE
jgi:cytochrome c oxidase subunit 2